MSRHGECIIIFSVLTVSVCGWISQTSTGLPSPRPAELYNGSRGWVQGFFRRLRCPGVSRRRSPNTSMGLRMRLPCCSLEQRGTKKPASDSMSAAARSHAKPQQSKRLPKLVSRQWWQRLIGESQSGSRFATSLRRYEPFCLHVGGGRVHASLLRLSSAKALRKLCESHAEQKHKHACTHTFRGCRNHAIACETIASAP